MAGRRKFVPATVDIEWLEQKTFMDFDCLIGFTITTQGFRDKLDDYFETQLKSILPNTYTEKFVKVADDLDDLVQALQDEVSARCEQLGVEECVREIKYNLSPPKKKRRQKKKRRIPVNPQIKLHRIRKKRRPDNADKVR